MKTPVLLIATFFAVIPGLCPEWAGRQYSVFSSQYSVVSSQYSVVSGHGIECMPLMDELLDVGANTVYTPAFRAAWTLLVADILGEYVKTVKPIPLAEKLNHNPYRPADPGDWVLEAGTVEEGVIERIKQSLMYRFHETDPSLDRWRAEKEAIICYARFVKAMSFKFPFETLEWDFSSGDETAKVACFGITKKRFNEDKDIASMQEQIKIHDYRHPDDFIVSLSTADPNTEIILAKVVPEASLLETVKTIDERIRRTIPEDFSNIDELMVPKIRLQADRTFHELIHQHLANKGFEEWFFAEARQSVEFSMDESGALAKATGEIVKIKGPTSRIYAFDKPFLVICRDKGSTEPVLVVWIASTGVMQKLAQ